MSTHFIAVSADLQVFLVGERDADLTCAPRDLRYFTETGQPLELTIHDGVPLLREVSWRTTPGEALYRLHRAVLAWADRLEASATTTIERQRSRELRGISGDLPTFVRHLLPPGQSTAGSALPPRPRTEVADLSRLEQHLAGR